MLKSVAHFLKGLYRSAMGLALSEANSGRAPFRQRVEIVLVSFSKAQRGLIGREILTRRFSLFSQAKWTELIRASERDAEEAATARRRRQRRRVDDLERWAAAGRQALEAAEIAPGTLPTLQALRDPSRRPPRPREEIPRELLEFEPATPLELVLKEFAFCEKGRGSRPVRDDDRPLETAVGQCGRFAHVVLGRRAIGHRVSATRVVEIVRMGRRSRSPMEGSEASCLAMWFEDWCRGPLPSK